MSLLATLSAEVIFIGGGGLAHWLIWLIAIIAIVAIVVVFIRYSGIPVPPWAGQILTIVVLAIVAIFAIRLIMSM